MKLLWKPLLMALGISVLLHALGGVVFRAAAVTETPPAPKPPLVTFLSPTARTPAIEDFREAIALADPSVSSLPNPRGFSSRAIARTNAVQSEIEARRINPQLLPLATNDPFMRTIVTEASLATLLAAYVDKRPALPVEEPDVTVPLTLPPTSSGFEIDGVISNRPFLALTSVPLVRSPAPPQPTVVRLAVSPLGEVKFAVLERSCGMEDKDARALDIIRRWRFQSVPDSAGDQWSTVSIYWVAERTAASAPAADTSAAPNREPQTEKP
jgi:hypothetical protein